MQLGINTLGGITADKSTGAVPTEPERLRDVVEQGVLAEQLGFAAFSVGEHHGDTKFVTSSPPVILAAIAARTRQIRLMTGVTLLPLLDPVRVAEDYATVDVISGGRVEIVAGKGNFANASRLLVGENDPDRGQRLRENLEVLLQIFDDGHVPEWSGQFRTPLSDAYVRPRPVQQRLPVWLGATRNLDSIELAARHGLPMLIAGFKLGTYADFAEHYRQSFAAAGHDVGRARLASLSTVVVSHDPDRARREYRDYWEAMVQAAAARDPRVQRVASQNFDDLAGPDGQIIIGTPDYVVERLVATHDDLGHELHFLQIDNGQSPAATAETMHLIAEEVAPHVIRATTATLPV